MAFERATKSYEATKEISRYVRRYYEEIYRAREEGKKIAWVTGLVPVEILFAMDIVPVFPENYNAFAAAKQMGAELCEAAEAMGYSRDVCSYGRLNLGVCFSGKGPYGALPEPDILFVTRNVCSTHAKWWEVLAQYYQKPLFMLDVPQVDGEFKPHQAEYFKVQFGKLVSFLEEQTGRRLDPDRFAEAMHLSARAGELWTEIRDYRKSVPCPISSADIFADMFLVVTVPGTQVAVDLLQRLRDEVKERVDRKQGVVTEEKFRLLWDNIAIWYNLGLMNYLERHGAVSVIETYTCYTGWGASMDLDHGLLEALIHKYATGYLNVDLDSKVRDVLQIAEEYKLDGALLFSNRSCKPYSVGQYDLKYALESKGVPSVMFEADMVDPRAYSEATIKNRLDAFMELLESRRVGK
ncbi:hypothetical protein SY88_20640 [Clostridiales bacterium PH28_bin88]|nr:hypothetical protein SY88_20640 [Clostridiales bacterium PH28_bin88]